MPRPSAFLPLLALVALLSPATARAESGAHLAADLDLGVPMDAGKIAVGGGGRFGLRFDLGPLWLQPEAGGSYTAFLGSPCDICVSSHAARVLGGLRLGGAGLISGVIEPALFAHGGYGWITSTVKGPTADVGFALDVRLVRVFRFGAHGAYNVVMSGREPLYQEPTPAVKWISFGLHAGVAL